MLTEFFTASCFKKAELLKPEAHKMIIIQSLKYLTDEEVIKVHAFVIMHNHFHLLWSRNRPNVQSRFMKFISHQIKNSLILNYPEKLEVYKTDMKDRAYHLFTAPYKEVITFESEANAIMGYIHRNPVKAKLARFPDKYLYSSANFYMHGEDKFGFLRPFSLQ